MFLSCPTIADGCVLKVAYVGFFFFILCEFFKSIYIYIMRTVPSIESPTVSMNVAKFKVHGREGPLLLKL